MLDTVLINAMSTIPNCVTIGVVDLASGTLLTIQSEESQPQELLNLMTTAITELFEAPLLRAFTQIYAGDASKAPVAGTQFTELLLLNDHHSYFLLRGRLRPQIAVFVVAKKETPAGLLMMRAAAALPDVENAL
jgi:hypothetical protein